MRIASLAGIIVLLCASAALADTVWYEWKVADGGNGHYYALDRSETKTWVAAEALAVSWGGHLVSVSSIAEFDFIYDAFQWKPDLVNYWTGLNDVGDDGNWGWSDGDDWDWDTSYQSWRIFSKPSPPYTDGQDSGVGWRVGGSGSGWSVWPADVEGWELYPLIEITSAPNAVPLPSAALAGLGLLGCIGIVRRVRRRRAA